jgi:hypothetical protein
MRVHCLLSAARAASLTGPTPACGCRPQTPAPSSDAHAGPAESISGSDPLKADPYRHAVTQRELVQKSAVDTRSGRVLKFRLGV